MCRLESSWAVAVQVAIVGGTVVAAVGLLPFLYLVGHWYLMQRSPLENWDSPLARVPSQGGLIRCLSSRGDRPSTAAATPRTERTAEGRPGLSFDDAEADAEKSKEQQQGQEGHSRDSLDTGGDVRRRLGLRAESQAGREARQEEAYNADVAVLDRQLRRHSSFGDAVLDTCSMSKVFPGRVYLSPLPCKTGLLWFHCRCNLHCGESFPGVLLTEIIKELTLA